MSFPWKNLSPKDGFEIKRAAHLSDTDQSVLTLLYLPLIKRTAYSMIMSWWSETTQTLIHPINGLLGDILTVQDIGIQEFYEARVNLEAVGLLKTYFNEERSMYVYELMPPLRPEQFFQDDILQLLLLSRVGEKKVLEIKKQFMLPKWDKKSYEEITRSFTDVYSLNWGTSSGSIKHVDRQLQQSYQPPEKPVSLVNNQKLETFDWDFFVENLKGQYLSSKSVYENRNIIQTLHLMYGIDELKMSRYLLETCEPSSGKVDSARLKRLVHEKERPVNRKNENNQEDPSTGNVATGKPVATEDAQLLKMSKSRNPADFLITIKNQKGGFLTKTEQWTLEELVSRSGLPNPVLNILIHYILVIKNSAVLEQNLAYKIANDWAQNKVSTPEQAMAKVRQLYQENTERKTTRNPAGSSQKRYSGQKGTNRKETLPEWAKENSSSKQEDKPLSEEEQQAFRERLKKIRSYRKEGES